MPAGRSRPTRGTGRHFLLPAAALDLTAGARVGPGDTVVDVGAGWGALTGHLARRAGRVLAVELDADLAAAVRRRMRHTSNVTVVQGDFLSWPLPRRPFRVVANLPFTGSTAILRRLLGDPAVPLRRADVVVQLGAARGWTGRPWRPDAVSWYPWYDVRLDRRLPRGSFRPAPSVDAAVLVAVRRPKAFLPAREHRAFVRFVHRSFRRDPGAGHSPPASWVEAYARAAR